MSKKELEEKWIAAWSKWGLGKIPERELKFSERKFRFDFAWPIQKVAVEIDGLGGWHQTAAMLSKDHEKSNLAQELGWVILRYTSRQLGSKKDQKEACQQVVRILKDRK